MILSKKIRKEVIGKKIVAFRLNKFGTGKKVPKFTFDPIIVLENGVRIAFVVEETESGEYGIEPVIITELKDMKK